MYRDLGNGTFQSVSAQAGPGLTQQFSSRGAAFGDFDNVGGMGVLILNMNDPSSLLPNSSLNRGNWIKVKLIGKICNRTAIGARVRVITGKHVQMDEVHAEPVSCHRATCACTLVWAGSEVSTSSR